jgi:hypothetical protein
MPASPFVFSIILAVIAVGGVLGAPAEAQLRGGGLGHPMARALRIQATPSPVTQVTASTGDGLLEAIDRLLVAAYRLERMIDRRDWVAAKRALLDVRARSEAAHRLSEPKFSGVFGPVDARVTLLSRQLAAQDSGARQAARDLLDELNVLSGRLAKRLAAEGRRDAPKRSSPEPVPPPRPVTEPTLPPDLQAALARFSERLDRVTKSSTPVPTPRPTPVPTPRPTPVPTSRPTPVPTSSPAAVSVRERIDKAYVAASTVYTYVRLGQDGIAQAELRALRGYLAAAQQTATPEQQRVLNELDQLAARLQQQLQTGDPAAYGSSRALTERFLQVQD